MTSSGIDALGADDDVVEILFVEDFQIFLELGDHDGQEMAVLVVGEDAAEFLHALLLVFALDDGAFVDADADGDFSGLAGLDDVLDLGAVVDVAGVEADLVDAGFDGFQARWKWKWTSATMGTSTCGRISLRAAVSFFSGTATRTMSAPAAASLWISATHLSMS